MAGLTTTRGNPARKGGQPGECTMAAVLAQTPCSFNLASAFWDEPAKRSTRPNRRCSPHVSRHGGSSGRLRMRSTQQLGLPHDQIVRRTGLTFPSCGRGSAAPKSAPLARPAQPPPLARPAQPPPLARPAQPPPLARPAQPPPLARPAQPPPVLRAIARARDRSRRQRAMAAWSPESSTAGTSTPRNTGGRV